MDPIGVTKDKSEANRVIEYYKKYSQNPDLLKYFTGLEASFVDKQVSNHGIRKEVELPHVMTSLNVKSHNNDDSDCIIIEPSQCNSQEITQCPESLDVEINQIIELEEIEEKNNSRSSSVASNKIEWDNGADIGYSNSYKLSTKRSASFPSLLTSNVSVKCNVLPTVAQEKSITEELRRMYHKLTYSYETSNSTDKDYDLNPVSKEPSTESSSSLQENRKKKSSTQSSSSNSSLQRKIGVPIAYSTPHEGSSSKESNSKCSSPHEETTSTSKSFTKYEGYTVTPMVTLPISKRKLNNDKPLNSSEQQIRFDGVGKKKYSLEKNALKTDKFQKKINLCLTKPISVECISRENKESVHKVVQTSFSSEKSSKCVQTEEIDLENMIFEPVTVCTALAQKIEYVKFHRCSNNESDTSEASSNNLKESMLERCIPSKGNFGVGVKNSETSKNMNLLHENSKTTQTDPVMNEKIIKSRKKMIDTKENKNEEIGKASKAQDNAKYPDSSELSSSVNLSRHTSVDKISTSGNVESTECGYKTADAADENQTEELLLTEMISLNHSKDLTTDIKRSIDILQKLLKSRKYDQATKKHYIKKIVQKIVVSKYSDDSTNSDLFKPKKSSENRQFADKRENRIPTFKGTSQLMDNKPWYPVSEPVYTKQKAKCKKTENSTKSKGEYNACEKKSPSDLYSKNNDNLIDSNVIRNHLFRLPIKKKALELPKTHRNSKKVVPPFISSPIATTSKNIDDQNSKQEVTNPEINEKFIKKTPRFTPSSSSRLVDSTSLDSANQRTSDGKNSGANWRTSKTLSEQLLENRDNIDFRKGEGDYLLNVVKNERHHQLSWINNEIEHLVKLKELLEKKPKNMKPESQLQDVISSLLKMKVDDMKVLSPSPLQAVHKNRSENSGKELQTHDEAPSMSSNSPANPTPMYADTRQPNLQVFMCSAEKSTNQKFSEQKKCSCSLEMCKCNQTTTHEEKDVQCPASKQCTCQTEPKEDANIQCNCKAHVGMTCNSDEATQDKENLCPCQKSSLSSSSSNSGKESYTSCVCCKKEKILKNLINKIPLCEPCQEVNQKNFYPHNYSNPLHSCLCYNLVDRDLLCQFKQKLTELERLDIYQQYCEVLKNCKCCKQCGCKCKLPKKFKNGCAYFLKLEDACPNTHCEGEEINSDSSNYEEDREDEKNDLPEVTVKVPNCRGSCTRKMENERGTKKYRSCPSIQNYLCTMKPDFIERAERRRRILKDATSQREENSENRKLKFIEKINYLNQRKRSEKFSSETDIFKPCGYQTKAYCVFDIELNDSPKRLQPRVFKSFKEMKDLTRRKYLHLNEVKSKKNIHREKRLREANRLLANTFTRRLQKSTLRGAVDIPLNVKVVSY